MAINAIKVVERRTVKRDYDFDGVEAIIDHPKHGRLFICDGFAGVGSLRGGAVRWEHGFVAKLKADDTFAALDAEDQRYVCPQALLSVIEAGQDDERPILEWDGHAVDRVAKAAGL